MSDNTKKYDDNLNSMYETARRIWNNLPAAEDFVLAFLSLIGIGLVLSLFIGLPIYLYYDNAAAKKKELIETCNTQIENRNQADALILRKCEDFIKKVRLEELKKLNAALD